MQRVSARLWVYPGVPHKFTTMDGLQSREKWYNDLVEGVRSLLSPGDFAGNPIRTGSKPPGFEFRWDAIVRGSSDSRA